MARWCAAGANTASRRRLTSPSTPRCGRTSTALPYCRDLPATRRQRKRVRRCGVVRQLGRRRSRRGAGGPPAQPSCPPLRPGRVAVGGRAPARRRAGPTACQVARPAVAHTPWSRLVHRLPRDLQCKPAANRGLARSLGFGHDTALERIAGSDSPERTFSASANRRCLPLFRGRGLGARRTRAGLAGWLRKPSRGWVMLMTALCGAVYAVLAPRALARYDALTVTTYAMVLGTLLLLPVALVEGLVGVLPQLDRQTMALLVFLGVFGGALGFFLWTFALTRLTPTQVAVYINLNPLVAMVLAAVLLAEPLTILLAAGFGAVLLGVLLVNWPKQN